MSSKTPKGRHAQLAISTSRTLTSSWPPRPTAACVRHSKDCPGLSRWHTIYPACNDATRTVKQGVAWPRALPASSQRAGDIFRLQGAQDPLHHRAGPYHSWWDQEPAHADRNRPDGASVPTTTATHGPRLRVSSRLEQRWAMQSDSRC